MNWTHSRPPPTKWYHNSEPNLTGIETVAAEEFVNIRAPPAYGALAAHQRRAVETERPLYVY